MFKLFSDAIFKPKKLIEYRKKSGLFVTLFVLILICFTGLVKIVKPLTTSISIADSYSIIQSFDNVNASIDDNYYYIASDYTEITIGDYRVGFYHNSNYIKTQNDTPDFVVYGNKLYYLGVIKLKEVATLETLSTSFKGALITSSSVDGEFIQGLKETVNKLKTKIALQCFISQAIDVVAELITFSLLFFGLMCLFYKAHKYMKKTQLLKMILFSSVSVILMNLIIELYDVPLMFEFVLSLISYIPVFKLERELANRIKIKVLGQGVLNDPEIIKKINEAFKLKKDEKENDDNNDEENKQ